MSHSTGSMSFVPSASESAPRDGPEVEEADGSRCKEERRTSDLDCEWWWQHSLERRTRDWRTESSDRSDTRVLSAKITSSSEGERKENDNSTASRTQRETYERERRLIPYMTYYVTPSITTRTNPEPRQNIFVPITPPRANIYQINAFPKIPITAIHTDSQQQIQILPKPLVRIQNPSILPQTIPSGKGGGIYPQIYSIGNQYVDDGVLRPTVPRPQLQPQQQIQSETQPLQLIKVNPVPIEQKYNAPQLIKIIPIITKLPIGDRSPKSFSVPPQQYAYARAKIQPIPAPQTFSDQQYYKESTATHNENFHGNKIYGQNHQADPQIRLIDSTLASDKNKYTLAKIVLSSTTSTPYADIKFKVDNVAAPIVIPTAVSAGGERLRPLISDEQVYKDVQGYAGGRQVSAAPGLTGEKYVSIPAGRQQVHYAQQPNAGVKQEPQDLIDSQNPQLPKLRVPLEEKIRFVATVTPVPVTNDLESVQKDKNYDGISSLLKETNKLPQNLTPHNIDAGIKTLALILERLQQQKDYRQKDKPSPLNSSSPVHSPADDEQEYHPKKVHSFPEKSGTSTPGRPGIDYPVYSSIPQTNFDCSTQRYKGFFGDPDTNCQVWHYCDLNGGQASFLCPNGTIFSQVALTCDWWFNVKCASTSQLYVLNERLYKYILPFSPSFPEDFSGPVVDTYLEAKFREMEAKSRKKGKTPANSTMTTTPEITTESSTEDSTETSSEHQTLLGEV